MVVDLGDESILLFETFIQSEEGHVVLFIANLAGENLPRYIGPLVLELQSSCL